ncbi:helix-turn-helix domain-containing protein [Moorena producens]|uniref:helix-turn-helix domain-containing protein n=1 Tax=Moorena producens TaxID=1155739 RepID=UPI003C743C2D
MTLLIDANNSKTTQAEDDPGTENQKIVYRSFTHLDGFKEFIDYQKMEMIQLSPGPLQAEFLSIQIGNLYFAYDQVNQGLHTSGGGTPEYMSFVMIWSEKEKEYYSLKSPIEPQRTLFGFNNTESYEVFHQGIALTHVFIPVQTFDAYADQLQRHDLDDNFRRKNQVNLLPTGTKEIKNYLKQLAWLAIKNPTFLQQPHIEKLVADDFIPLLISQIPIKLNSKCFLKPSRRAKLIAQAEQEMLAHLEKPLTLKQLAQNLGSSSSALSYGFQDLFGLSPMRYLKVRRLNAVRQRLKASEPERCTIALLASEFGFYHLSHFAKDYKAMFGELPSETLRNTAN